MHRLLVDPSVLEMSRPQLSAEAAKHLKVLRPEAGETIELFDGRGAKRVYHYDAATRALGNPDPVTRLPAPSRPVTLFACVTKGSRWDWTIEKATELGVSRIVPVISDRTIVRLKADEREAKRERWRRIAEDAARQSDAVWLPEVLAAVDFKSALELVKQTRCFTGALTTPPPLPMAAAVRATTESAPTDDYAVFVGPEGDFTPDELSALLAVSTPVNLGPTILRAETAAIVAISILSAELQLA